MPRITRISDIVEILAERAFFYGICGLFGVGFSTILLIYRGAGTLVPFASVVLTFSILAVGHSGYLIFEASKVKKTGLDIKCPFCDALNRLEREPTDDFPCNQCNRMIPIRDAKPLPVMQVRCGYCNELNFYSEKSQVLLCEGCNHEIPIFVEEGRPTKQIPKAFIVQDPDDSLYELWLTGIGKDAEDLIHTLQTMLALNRNQVKQMLTEIPVALLTGINKRKGEMLVAQLGLHDGIAEIRRIED